MHPIAHCYSAEFTQDSKECRGHCYAAWPTLAG